MKFKTVILWYVCSTQMVADMNDKSDILVEVLDEKAKEGKSVDMKE